MIEIRGLRMMPVVVLCLAGIFVIPALLITLDAASPASVTILCISAPATALAMWRIVRRKPQLVATDAGVSFGGRPAIPWADIKMVYATGIDVVVGGTRARSVAIAFDFHARRTLVKLPITYWLASPFSVGDVDVSPRSTGDRPTVLASRLEAMRVRAGGTEDARAVGAGELPAARVVERES